MPTFVGICPATNSHKFYYNLIEMATTADVFDHLKVLYEKYRATTDMDLRGLFFSPQCVQICRTNPDYAATSREGIVEYMRESHDFVPSKGHYTIRPLRDDEFTFETDDVVAPTGLTSAILEQRAKAENWVGTRVDLWWEAAEEKNEILVKVQYWWRKEQDEWLQVLHDIMYMGPLDGTEGQEGQVFDCVEK